MSVFQNGTDSAVSIRMPRRSGLAALRKGVVRHWQLYLLVFLPIVYVIVFSYAPMYGTVIAFKDYKISQSIWDSKWVGLKHFKTFFTSYQLPRLLGNTIGISAYSIVAGTFPPILLALGLNYCTNKFFGKTVQMSPTCPTSSPRF
jgi:ABC-type polysaccharide transport system permease subunit